MRLTMRLKDRGHRWYTWLHDQYLLPGKTAQISFPLGVDDIWQDPAMTRPGLAGACRLSKKQT